MLRQILAVNPTFVAKEQDADVLRLFEAQMSDSEVYLRICAGATDIRSCKGLRPSEKVSDGLGPSPDLRMSKILESDSIRKNKMLHLGLNGQMSDSKNPYLRICAGATDIRSCKGLRPSEKKFQTAGPGPDILLPAEKTHSRNPTLFERTRC